MSALPEAGGLGPGFELARLCNVVHEPWCTCGVCATPVEGYALCWRCVAHRRTAGLADLVAPLCYAVDGQPSAAVVRNFKNHPVRAERRRCAAVIHQLLDLGTSLHMPCLGVVAGQPVSAAVVIPSLTSRPGRHPIAAIAESLGLLGDVGLRATLDARCDRVVDGQKFSVDGPVAGRHVLVVDDVWTTGSNVQSAALALRGAGARAVSVMVAARWLNPRHPLSARFIRRRLTSPYDPLVCPVTGDRCP
jgi:hypothetical protein